MGTKAATATQVLLGWGLEVCGRSYLSHLRVAPMARKGFRNTLAHFSLKGGWRMIEGRCPATDRRIEEIWNALFRLARRLDIPISRISLNMTATGSYVLRIGGCEVHIGRERDIVRYLDTYAQSDEMAALSEPTGEPCDVLASLIDAWNKGDAERFQFEFHRAQKVLGYVEQLSPRTRRRISCANGEPA